MTPDNSQPQLPQDMESSKDESKSQLDLALEFAFSEFELFHDNNKNCYAKNKKSGLIWRLDGTSFRDYLSVSYYENQKRALRSGILTECVTQLCAFARYKNECRTVFYRVAKLDDSYYLDLCEEDSTRAICWHRDGWSIIGRPPVEFVRSDAMQPLPVPVTGGDIELMWQFCNIPQHMRIFVLAWIIDAWRPDTIFPGMELLGEQGCGKSTTSDIIRRLVDPNSCNLRGAPKTAEDVFVAAGANHLLVYENLSWLTAAIQDTLCVISTGGGFAKRRLFTDADEHVISVKRPWLINGISACVTQQDLVDRVISIECQLLGTRIAEREQQQELALKLPQIMGALLDIACNAERLRPNIELPEDNRPRLLEYCLLGMAITQHLYQDAHKFLEQFNSDRRELVSRTIDTSPICAALIELLSTEKVIEAPLSAVLNRLKRPEHSADNWPRSPKALGDMLRRHAPALRQYGVQCRSLGKIGSHVLWHLSKQDIEASRECREVVDSI